MNKKKKYYVYMHLYNDKPVYCGKGTVNFSSNKNGYDSRAKDFSKRNQRYLDFVKEVGRENIEVFIISRFDEEQDAIWLENNLHDVFDGLYSMSDKQLIHRNRYECGIPVVQLTLDGQLVKEHPNANVEGFRHNTITECCRNKRKSHKGYVWIYAKDYHNGNYYIDSKTKNRKTYTKDSSIVVISKDNKYYFDDYSKCKRTLNISVSKVVNRDDKFMKKNKLFVIPTQEYSNETFDELVDKYKVGLVRLNKNYNLVKHYLTTNDIEDEFNATKISDCIRGVRKTHRDYIWMRYKDYCNLLENKLIA